MVVVLLEKRPEKTRLHLFGSNSMRSILGCPGVLFDGSRRKLDRTLGIVIAAVFVLGALPSGTACELTLA